MAGMTMRALTDVLAEQVALDGRDVLDVGCGAGGMVRWFREQGARPVGVECGDAMRRRAVDADPEHADAYVDAVGQDLPFDDGSFDVVHFMASLHHVPVDDMPAALGEAARVVRPGGVVYVVEPAVEEPDDDVLYPVVDERGVRTAAQAAIDAAAEHGLEVVDRFEFEREVIVADFDEWMAEITDIDTERAAALDEHRETVRRKFERLGRPVEGGHAFRRRTLAAVMRKPVP
jgi:ubiquinone/menaquinone biosynthesis C-methylase UbiE